MKIHRRHKKIFYVPGMISLVLIPLMCIVALKNNKAFLPQNCIELGVLNSDSEVFKEIRADYGFPIPRHYQTFTFKGKQQAEKTKIRQLQLALRKLKKEKDTINGIQVHFNSTTVYPVFIDVIDLLRIEDMPTYIPLDNDIWVLIAGKPKKKKDKIAGHYMNCGTAALQQQIYEMQAAEEKAKSESILLSTYKQKKWPLYAAFLFIVGINIFAFIKWNRHKSYVQKSYI